MGNMHSVQKYYEFNCVNKLTVMTIYAKFVWGTHFGRYQTRVES